MLVEHLFYAEHYAWWWSHTGATTQACFCLLQVIVGRRATANNYTRIFNFKFGPCHIEKKVFVVENGKAELLPVWGGGSQRDFFRGAAPFTPRPGIWRSPIEHYPQRNQHMQRPWCWRSSDFQRTERKQCDWCIKAFRREPGVSSFLAMFLLNSLTSFFKLTS